VRLTRTLAIVALAIAATACAHNGPDPQALADDTTRGVYNVDLDATTAHFDDALKTQVTRGTIGQLSDAMHALGTYHGLKAVNSDADKGRYDFQAAFDKGTLLVQLRLDPDGKIGAYRVAPPSSSH
jgi:predicted metal-dependent phosphoesterase TrpH